MMHGTWKTTGTATISTGGALALIGAAVVLAHPKQAEGAATGALTIAAVTVGAVAAIALATIGTVVYLRLRGRSRNTDAARPAQTGIRWQANPDAIPVRPRREIAAPVVAVNIDAGLLAGLMNAVQQQQPVHVIPEQAEQQQEIQR